MALPPIKRSAANKLAKFIRDSNKLTEKEKENVAYHVAAFFSQEDPFFRADIFYQVATGKLANDPAIKNPQGFNQYGNKKYDTV